MGFRVFVIGSLASTMALAEASSHFVSTIQFSVREPSAPLMQRSQGLVKAFFAQGLEASPELRTQSYEVRMVGNEVVFYLVTDNDMRTPMRLVLSSLVENLNGKVKARGRSSFFRTTLSQPVGGYLETVVNDDHTAVVSLTARSIPLRDLLKQLRTQLTSMSYVVPGDCADQRVDWSFGKMGPSQPRTISSILSALATHFNLTHEVRNGTHVLHGGCTDQAPRVAALATTEFEPAEFAPPLMGEDFGAPPVQAAMAPGFMQVGFGTAPHVYVPVFPIGD